jgi:hypothetical protein
VKIIFVVSEKGAATTAAKKPWFKICLCKQFTQHTAEN